MRIIDRFVITLAALLTLSLGIGALALVAGWNGTPWAVDVIAAARGSARVEAGLIGLLAVAVALYLLAVAWQREQAPGAIQQAGQLGDIHVSLRAVESLVLQAASAVRGVREASARLHLEADQLVIDVVAAVTSERPVPEVSGEVQAHVAQYVRDTVGVDVARVGVQVRHIDAARKTRVE